MGNLDRRTVVVVVALAVLAAGLLGPALVGLWAKSNRVTSQNNLRMLAQFAAQYEKAVVEKVAPPERAAVPAGTLVNPALPADRRMSWVPAALPFFDQRFQNTAALLPLVDPAAAWDESSNADLGNITVKALLCPGGPDPAPRTDYVGIAGLGSDAAALGLGPPVPPTAGCFRYDAATPLALISARDGLSNTFLFAETSKASGPWLRGGPGTVRGLDPAAPPFVGPGGQFGGFRADGALFAFADGAVELITSKVDPRVFRAHFTIAGGPAESEPLD